jgi:DNA-binding response OmpR family regulator
VAACVLVVEDERKIRELLRDYLEHDGLDVITTGSGAEGIKLAREAAPDLILLDLRLPDVPGEEVAREVRAASRTPIMMLTAKTDTEDRIRGLELGADDYVTKPFSPREVLLRVRAILRRAGSEPEADAPASYGGGRLVIDEPRRQVNAAGHPVTLTATEWKLLTTLASVPGRVFSRYELINRARGYEYDGYERTIDSHIRNLRHKIEPDPHAPGLIETVTGAGYRLAITRDRQPGTPQAAWLPARAATPRDRSAQPADLRVCPPC